jgi:hypothetical protein
MTLIDSVMYLLEVAVALCIDRYDIDLATTGMAIGGEQMRRCSVHNMVEGISSDASTDAVIQHV